MNIPYPHEYLANQRALFYCSKYAGEEEACNMIADQSLSFADAYNRSVDYHNGRREKG